VIVLYCVGQCEYSLPSFSLRHRGSEDPRRSLTTRLFNHRKVDSDFVLGAGFGLTQVVRESGGM